METLRYTIIRNQKQYDSYTDMLEMLVEKNDESSQEEIDLLNLLIEKWDDENSSLKDADPIEMLKFLMQENGLKAKDLVGILNLSKGTISKILNYHKGLSKESIRKLSKEFRVSQEAFNRPYKLNNSQQSHAGRSKIERRRTNKKVS